MSRTIIHTSGVDKVYNKWEEKYNTPSEPKEVVPIYNPPTGMDLPSYHEITGQSFGVGKNQGVQISIHISSIYFNYLLNSYL